MYKSHKRSCSFNAKWLCIGKMPRGHVRQRLLLMSDRRSIGRSAQAWSADTHWAVCTGLSSGCRCWGPGSPRATASSSQRRVEVPFQSRSGGWRGGFMGLRPTLPNEADTPSPAAHPAPEKPGSARSCGRLGASPPTCQLGVRGHHRGHLVLPRHPASGPRSV